MLEFLPQNGGIDAEFLRDLAGQFVAHDPAGHSLDMRQQIIQRLHFALSTANGELVLGALDQVIEITLRVFERLAVSIFTFAADEEIRVEAGFQSQHFDLEFFFDQKTQGALGGLGTGGVGIEIHDNVLAEAAQQPGLEFGEGGSGTGDHVVKASRVDRNAIHLALDQDGVIKLANRFLGLIEIEQDARLGVDRGLG